jgi:hypothetical protein
MAHRVRHLGREPTQVDSDGHGRLSRSGGSSDLLRAHLQSQINTRENEVSDRPQYHFTAPANRISDPNGLIRCNGVWHIYGWAIITIQP